MKHQKLLGLGLALLACALSLPLLWGRYGSGAFRTLFPIELALWAAGAWSVLRSKHVPGRTSVVVVVALALRVAVAPQAPLLSDDAYRYVWDGRVQAAGINPYRFVPAAPELAHLRDTEIFEHINRRDYARTIYPPAAEVFFFLAHALGGGMTGIKLLLSACDVATILLLVKLLRARGEDPARVVLYAWNPLVWMEIAQSGHIDGLAILLVVAAITAIAAMNRGTARAFAGALLGLAALVKGYPLLIAPAFLRRGRLAFCAGLLATFLLYIPYATVGSNVLGFLPTYVREEGLISGERFTLLRAARLVADIPTSAFVMLAGAIGLGLVLRVLLRDLLQSEASEEVARHALLLGGAALVLATPHFAWYYVWLAPLTVLAPSFAWLYLACSGALLYYEPRGYAARIAFELAQDVPLVALLAWEARKSRLKLEGKGPPLPSIEGLNGDERRRSGRPPRG